MQDLKKEFQDLVDASMSVNGVTLDPTAENAMANLIDDGIQEMTQGQAVPTPAELHQAQVSLLTLIGEISRSPRALQTMPVDESTLRSALKVWCPLPPWTKKPCP